MTTARFLGPICWVLSITFLAQTAVARIDHVTQGRLDAVGKDGKSLGKCPLKHTDVRVDIAGFVARVAVRQQFHNPFKERIEAIYTFPLSQNAAVDHMTMKIGDRLIVGQIKERDDARRIYEAAKAAGHLAGLLDQERPNIFTQAVANIEPGQQVDITIKYSETLDWRDGKYQFDFPMVVGPRYMPGTPSGGHGSGWSPPTDQVPDANRISPPVMPPGTRAGHDISVTVNLDAGLPLRNIESLQHGIVVTYRDEARTRATIILEKGKEIPNKDFALEFQTSTDEIEDTVLTHTDERGKFFTLVLQPPQRVRPEAIVPKEIIFVIDKSGSMKGFPIETAKQTMRRCIEGLHPKDTFNLITFERGVGFCFPKPVPNSDGNRRQALGYLAALEGSGGTEMMSAVQTCLAGHEDPERLRVVCFMTDGKVGNDMAIIDAVQKKADRVRCFAFGIGTSVNRYLLDGIARAGRGEVHYVLDEEQANGAAERFYERVRTPVLTDIQLDFGKLEVEEVFPAVVPDLFSVKPVVVTGRYKQGGRGKIALTGTSGDGKFKRKIKVRFPKSAPDNKVLASLWARAKVESLVNQDLAGIQRATPQPDIQKAIVDLGLRYQLLTRYTSFVAVEHQRKTEGDGTKSVVVPVEIPEGVSYEGVFGAVTAVNDELAGLRRRLRAAQSVPDCMTAEVADHTHRIHQARSIRAALEERRKQLESELSRRRVLLQRHGISADEPADKNPPALDGVVTAVSKNLVEISLGSDDGIRDGHELDVFNNNSYLGRVKIRKTAPNRAVGEIMPEYKKGEIHKGVQVATRLGTSAGRPTASGPDGPRNPPQAGAAKARGVAHKLTPELRGLAERVAREGKDGNLTAGKIEVKNGRILVRVQVTSFSDKTLAQLKSLGFQERSKTQRPYALIGTIEVSRLDNLAALDVVVQVDPETGVPHPSPS